VPVKVFGSGDLGAWWEDQCFTQWWPPVVLPGQRVGLHGVSKRAGKVYAQPSVDGEQTGVEGDIVGGASSQAVTRVESFAGSAVLPWLDMACQQHAFAAERRRAQATEHASAATVSQHVRGEHMLSYPYRRQQDPYRIKLGQLACGRMQSGLFAQVRLQDRDVEFLLAEQDQLTAIFQFEEIRQARRADTLSARGIQQHPVDAGKPR